MNNKIEKRQAEVNQTISDIESWMNREATAVARLIATKGHEYSANDIANLVYDSMLDAASKGTNLGKTLRIDDVELSGMGVSFYNENHRE